MYRDEYGKKHNAALYLLVILLILLSAAAAYFFIDQTLTRDRLAKLDAADYTSSRVDIEKAENIPPPGIALSAETEVQQSGDVYNTPLGFPIISYSDKWTGDKLIDIYNELMRNTHGQEIESISKVVVHPGNSPLDTEDSSVAGAHTTQHAEYDVFFNLPGLVPKSLKYGLASTLSVIELYNMDEFDTAKQAAKTIAHEYGHHFTMYYFMQNDAAVRESAYYSLRGFDDYDQPVFYEDAADYYANHRWSIYEIAAEDYVQLMGSPSAKQPVEYIDIYDWLFSSDEGAYTKKANETTVNVFPQENIDIPLSDEIPGLRDYFYSFIDKENTLVPLAPADIQISMQKHEKYGYTYYDITWTKPSGNSKSLYTLVSYDTDKNAFAAIKTTYGNEQPVARVGTVARLTGTQIISSSDGGVTDEDRYFKVYLILPDGRMQSSEPFYADF